MMATMMDYLTGKATEQPMVKHLDLHQEQPMDCLVKVKQKVTSMELMMEHYLEHLMGTHLAIHLEVLME